MSLIYLASPYSHPDAAIREDRWRAAMLFCARAAQNQHCIVSPIAHWHVAASAHELPTDALYWEKANMQLLRHCTEVWVLTLPGWHASAGVRFEIETAERLYIPVRYVTPLHFTTERIENGHNAIG